MDLCQVSQLGGGILDQPLCQAARHSKALCELTNTSFMLFFRLFGLRELVEVFLGVHVAIHAATLAGLPLLLLECAVRLSCPI